VLRAAAALALALALFASAALARPPDIRVVSFPRTAVVGAPWRVAVAIRPAARATLELRGASVIRKRLAAKKGVASTTVRFPRAGRWAAKVTAGEKTTRLGTVDVDVPRSSLIVDPLTITAEPSGSLLVGQLRQGGLLRVANGRVEPVATGVGTFHVAVAGGVVYAAGQGGAVYRVDGSAFTPISPPIDASSVAVDAAGNIYVTVYAGWIKKIAPSGQISVVAGDGTEGYTGDGGPATAAKIFHPHALVIGRDGALYVADTENRRIRRIDLATGVITTFGGDVGITVSLAVGPDGSIYSGDIIRDGAGGGVTKTTPAGVTTRIVSSPTANGVAVAPDGTVYVNLWEEKRIQRLNGATGRLEPVARG
jgi:sugar lactone lactonase YvrE